ncbi:hypothetical protein ARHIZOSPH14_14330 [Agromyces rhizosphaerae]|uniref:Uncharacterized protein n=1 Tax=Agromyces rhizosphaerae TaxID=88374 RepID=A0A9W6CQV1_9MICO|nr:hypothetical protein ARHIZOSPH14_14330 [Agromyces rhizosphaerae]
MRTLGGPSGAAHRIRRLGATGSRPGDGDDPRGIRCAVITRDSPGIPAGPGAARAAGVSASVATTIRHTRETFESAGSSQGTDRARAPRHTRDSATQSGGCAWFPA